MAQLAILAAIEVGLAVTQYFLTPKPKTQAIDRGRLDDLRIQSAEEGAHIPIPLGRQVRMAGVIVDGEATREYKTTTPGRSGGKGGGGGGGGEGPVTTFGYKKTFAILGGEGPIKNYLQIKETTGSGTETIYDLRPSVIQPSSIYEAEAAANTLAGGALIIDDITMSGSKRVSLPAGASVTIAGVRANGPGTRTYELVIYYVSSATQNLGIKIDAAAEVNSSLFSSAGIREAFSVNKSLSPTTHSIRLKNNGSSSMSIDSIFLFPALPDDDRVTGIIHPTLTYPTDPARPNAFYNYAPYANGAGEITGTLAAGGQSPFELYLGTEDQLQSPTLVALHGAAHVSAMRGFWYVVANQYEVKNGQLGNFTFTVEPMIQDLADVLSFFYLRTDQVDPGDHDFTRVAGTIVEGMIYDRGDPINAYIDALQLWYNFDIVPCGGKITAIPRGGAALVTVPEIDLFGREEGEDIPHGALSIDHINELEISGAADVLYSDISETKDFHTGKQHYSRELANTDDPDTISVPLVSDADTAHAVAKRVVWEKILSAKPSEWATGPKYRYLLPTDVVNLTADNAVYTHRIVSAQRAQSGLVKFKSVPEKGAIYDQVGAGIVGSGTEIPPVAFPPNTYLALLDIPPLRLEDDQLGYYAAVCPYGAQGKWRGAILYKEEITGVYDRVTSFERAATIGVLAEDLPAVADPSVFDRTNEIVLDLLFDEGLFESHPEADILSRPVNVLVIGSADLANIVQFCDVTYETATAPYVARVRLSTLLHGRVGTDFGAKAGAVTGTSAVLMNDELKFRNEDPSEVGAVRNFKAASVGQAQADAPVTSFTFRGFSKQELPPTNPYRLDLPNGDAIFGWTPSSRIGIGMRPGTDVTLLDLLFDFEPIVSGVPRTARRIRVDDTEHIPWEILRDPKALVTQQSDGGLSISSIGGNYGDVLLVSKQTLLPEDDVTFSFTVDSRCAATSPGPLCVGLIKTSRIPTLSGISPGIGIGEQPDYGFVCGVFGEGTALCVNTVSTQLIDPNSHGVDELTVVRLTIQVKGGVVRYYQDLKDPSSPAFHVGVSPITESYKLFVRQKTPNTAGRIMTKPRLLRNSPTYLYTAAAMTADGITVPDPVHFKVYAVSALVGRGRPLEATL
jgi:putative tail protein